MSTNHNQRMPASHYKSLRAAIYIRVSGKNQEKNYSLPTQLEGCLKYCQEHGYIVDKDNHIYKETMTGVIYRERMILNATRAAARRKEFDVLVVYDVDRFSRDPVHQLIISDELAQYDVKLECVLREVDNSDEGKLIQFSRGLGAKLEYERFRDRTERGYRARFADGYPRAGACPLYDYEWVDGVNADGVKKKKVKRQHSTEVVYIDQQGKEWTKANVVFYLLEELKQGKTYADVAIDLNTRGIPSPAKGKQWRKETISRIVNNDEYAGIAETNKRQSVKKANGRTYAKLRPPEERTRFRDGVTPPFISLEDLEEIRKRAQRHRDLAPRNSQNPARGLLNNGYARCAYCDRAMRIRKSNGGLPRKDGTRREAFYYACPCGDNRVEKCSNDANIRVEELDNVAWEYLKRKINNPQEVEKFVKNDVNQKSAIIQEEHAIKQTLANIEQEQKEKLNDLEHLHASYKEIIYARLNELAAIKIELEKNLRQVASLVKSQEEIEEEIQDFKKWCNDFGASVDQENVPYHRKREACERFHIRVIIYKRDPITGKPRFEIEAEPIIVLRSTDIEAPEYTLVDDISKEVKDLHSRMVNETKPTQEQQPAIQQEKLETKSVAKKRPSRATKTV